MDKTETNNGARSSIGTDYVDALMKSKGSNEDTDGLGMMAAGPLVIGSVDAINGKEGEEVPEFSPRHELERLAAYWWTERIDRDFDWFVYQQTGSSEWRGAYTSSAACTALPNPRRGGHGKRFDDASARWRKLYKISDEDWRVFTRGSDQEQEAWRETQWRKQEEAEALAAVRELAEDASKSEGSSDYAARRAGYPGPQVPHLRRASAKGTKHVCKENRWCEKCFWDENGEEAIAKFRLSRIARRRRIL